MRRLSVLLLISLLLASGCEEEDLTPRPFFSTTSLKPEFNEDRLTSYTLRADFIDLNSDEIAESCDRVAEFGFYFHPVRARVEAGEADVKYLVDTPTSTGVFTLPAPPMEVNRWYYYRPFISCNDRTMSTPVDSLMIDLDVAISPRNRRRNDTIDYQLEVSGVPTNLDRRSMGYLVLAENGIDTIVHPVSVTAAEANEISIGFPAFNTGYLVRPYLYDGTDYYFGEDHRAVLTDGWIPIAGLTRGIHELEAATLNGAAYLFGGCTSPLCITQGASNPNIYELDFPPGTPPDSLTFVDPPEISRNTFTMRSEGASFVRGEMIWHINGRSYDTGQPINELTGARYSPASGLTRVGDPVRKQLRGTVAFALMGRYFFGWGDDLAGAPRKEFYEINFNSNGIPEFQLNSSIPEVRLDAEDLMIPGRREAVAVATRTGVLLGSGFSSATILSDFYHFTLPTPDASRGEWHQVEPLPVGRRSATSFSIDGRAFVGLGRGIQRSYFRDIYEFSDDGGTGEWLPREPFPGRPRGGAVGFSINGYGCICGGKGNDPDDNTDTLFSDCWLYEPVVE